MKTENLLAAGRCISASDDAWSVTRAIGACAVTGEAAGTAAALLAKEGTGLKEFDTGMLQKKLIKQNVIINKNLLKYSSKGKN